MNVNKDSFDTLTKGLRTKSDKIRALARDGAATADIAHYLGIRYQHARNVLVKSGLHTRRADPNGEATTAKTLATDMPAAWVRIDALGRLQIPADLMKLAGLAGDEPVYVSASKDGVEILSRRTALKRAHDIARRFVPDGVSLVDELIAERRREAATANE